MNSTKTKLVSAIAMLVVASIMMTSASFAWFTVSTAPEVSGIEVELAATRNFEIAMVTTTNSSVGPSEPKPGDADEGEGTWGASVSFTGCEPFAFPATVSGGSLYSVDYSSTGRVDNYVETREGDFEDGIAYYYATIASISGTPVVVTVGATYGIWLRSNTAATVKVSMGGVTASYVDGTEVSGNAVARMASAASVTVKDGSDIIQPGGTFAMSANEAKKVYVTCYFDGEYVYAEDVVHGLEIDSLSIEFVDTNDSTKTKGTNTGNKNTDYTPLVDF